MSYIGNLRALVREEFEKQGCTTRRKIIKLALSLTNSKQISYSVVGTADQVIKQLRKEGYIKTVEPGLYIKI